jgi:D-beta-D-heptose 7-phosphate kinase/D-beta-D-heptose 1-phosphate adenosyltransferase
MKKYMSQKRISEVMDRMSQSHVLVIGDVMFDHFIWGSVSRISPEAPVPVVDVQKDNLLLGGCANVLNNIYAMGGRVYLTGVVGDDDMGAMLVSRLKKMKIPTGGIIEEDQRPTTLKTRVVAHHQQVVRFDRESRQPVSESSIEKMVAYIKTIRNKLGAVVISDYGKGVVTPVLLDEIRRLFAGRRVVICVDPKKNDFSFYHGVDIITPNHHEAERALGVEDLNGDEAGKEAKIKQAVQKLIDRLKLTALLITRGEKGMTLFEADDRLIQTNFPAEAKEVFDVTGAGDTVIGVFALAVASGATFQEAAFLANHAAGIVVGKVGTATVSQKELKKVL